MIPRLHRWVVVLLLTAQTLLGMAFYRMLPARVPIHWNVRGEPNGFGGSWVDAFVLPAISWVLMTLIIFAPLLGPFRRNMLRFARTYGRICVAIAAFLLCIHAVILLAAAGHPALIGPGLTSMAGIAFAVIGNWMGKIRRNPWVGIRTPWTLGSDEVWERTHRAGGKIAVIFGMAVALVSLAAPPLVSLGFLLSGLIGLCAWAFVYSYRLHYALARSGRT